MTRMLPWLSLFAAVFFLFPFTASANSCRYDILPLDPSAAKVEVRVLCSDPSLLDKLRFAYDSVKPYLEVLPIEKGTYRYRVDLKSYADSQDDYESALRRGQSTLFSPEALFPSSSAIDEYRLYADGAKGAQSAMGYEKLPDGGYRISGNRWDEAGAMVLGQFHSMELPGEDGMRIVLMDEPVKASFAQLTAWLADTAKSNSRFWHHPPVKAPLVILIPKDSIQESNADQLLPFGRVNNGSNAVMLLLLRKDAEAAKLYDEWVGVHEFLHLGTPFVRDTGAWFNEGIATYYEPLLRYRAGWKSEDEIWQEWIRNMPRGMKAMSELGLRNSGRGGVYWGGALFMLLSDMGLREASQGRIGMEDCLTAILDKVGNASQMARTTNLLSLCDEVAGNQVVTNIGRSHIDQGTPIDLQQIWSDLGVALKEDGTIAYNDKARLAWVRKSLVQGNKAQFSSAIDKTMPVN